MRNLLECILEKLTINQAREYLMVKRDPRAQAWLDAFWERVKDLPGAEVNKNGHRIYFNFTLPTKDLEMGDQQSAYGRNESAQLKMEIEDYLKADLNYDIRKLDYIHGTVDVAQQTQRGEKIRTLKIGKLLKNKPDMMAKFAADPIRLTSKLDTKKLYIVLSNHAYDIAGMSADRKWTSCMDVLGGSNRQWVKEDIKWGTVVAYLVEENDKNINNPLGRILIKPYLDENDAIVYFPEPTVYSPYVGLDSMKEYLQDACSHIANRVSWLYKIARDFEDPEQTAPSHDDVDPKEFTKEDWEAMEDMKKGEWEKLEKLDNKKFKFLLYYDDYFAKNKNYVGVHPQVQRKTDRKKLK